MHVHVLAFFLHFSAFKVIQLFCNKHFFSQQEQTIHDRYSLYFSKLQTKDAEIYKRINQLISTSK